MTNISPRDRAARFAAVVVFALGCVLGAQTPPQGGQTPEQRAQAVVEQLSKQDFSGVIARFNATMKAALSADQLRTAWAGTVQQAGAFRRQAGTKVESRGQYQVAVVTCEFERMSMDVQIAFDSTGLVAGLSMRPAAVPYTPPPYSTSGAFTEEETTVGSGDWVLPGTLTMPAGDGPFPAVVLVHGSGPNDRDETLGPNKIFKDLAVGLASRGIAVLRYDKRTFVYGAKLAALSRFTVKEETTDDALLAVARLRATPKIDPKRVFVLGHSLGGMLVPRLGVTDAPIAGFIMMAGTVRSIPEAMLGQTRYLALADGTVSLDEKHQIDQVQAMVDAVKGLTQADASNPAPVFGVPASYWLDLRNYDPAETAVRVKAPMLILQGERDYQATMADDFAKWKAALSSKTSVTFHTYPALNHEFIAGSGPSLPSEYGVPGHVDPAVIRDIVAWIAGIK